jgi:hypothetical protein
MLTTGNTRDGVTDAYRAAFRRTHIRILVNWAIVIALPFVSWALTGSPEAVLHWRLPLGATYVIVGAAALAHHFWGWRCPRCGAYQGRWILEAKCATCGLTTG